MERTFLLQSHLIQMEVIAVAKAGKEPTHELRDPRDRQQVTPSRCDSTHCREARRTIAKGVLAHPWKVVIHSPILI